MVKEWMNGFLERNLTGTMGKLNGYIIGLFMGTLIVMYLFNPTLAMEIAAISSLTTLGHIITGAIKYE